MKIYSDRLQAIDFCTAANAAGIQLGNCDSMRRPQLRRNGWNVWYGNPSSKRSPNSGTRGGPQANLNAASWDEWGIALAALYEIDLQMIAGPYRSADDFHAKTGGKYRTGCESCGCQR